MNKVCNFVMTPRPDIALLLVRIVLGVVFVFHGWMKINNMEMTTRFFESMGLPMVLAYAVAIIELVGGILVLIGYKARYAAIFLALVMLGALLTAKSKAVLAGSLNVFELDLALLALAVVVKCLGTGKFAIEKSCSCCKDCKGCKTCSVE